MFFRNIRTMQIKFSQYLYQHFVLYESSFKTTGTFPDSKQLYNNVKSFRQIYKISILVKHIIINCTRIDIETESKKVSRSETCF